MDCYTKKGNSLDLDYWFVMSDPGTSGQVFPFSSLAPLLIDVKESRGLSFGGRRSIAAVVE
jgi:chitodextrinase